MLMALEEFLAELAAATPAPGGGAAAAVSAAMGAALCAMVVGLGCKKKGGAAAVDVPVLEQLQQARQDLLAYAERDAAAFAAYLNARRAYKRGSEATLSVDRALVEATEVPVHMVDDITALLRLIPECLLWASDSTRADLRSACLLFDAAAGIAIDNARENAARLQDPSVREQTMQLVAACAKRQRMAQVDAATRLDAR